MSEPNNPSATFPLIARLRQILQLVRLKPFDMSTAAGRSAERHRRIALSSLTAVAAKVVGVLTLLVTVPLTIKYLGTERYGLWMTISSVIAMLGCADLGIGMGLINIISDANGRDDVEAARRYVSSAVTILTGIAMGLLLLFLALYPFVSWEKVFNLKSPQAIAEAGPAVAIFVACFAIGIPLNIVPSVQSGYQQSFFSSLWISVGNLLGLIGVLICVRLKLALPWLVLSMAGSPLLSRIGETIMLFAWQRPALMPRWRSYDSAAARRVLKTGLFFFVLALTISIGYTSDSMVITQVLGPEYVSEYAVTYRLFSIAPTLLGFVLAPLWPAYGEAIARGDAGWVRRTLFRSLRLALMTVVPAALVFVLFGRPIVYVWSRHEVMPGRLLLIALALWTATNCVGGPLAMFFNGLSVIRFQVICASLMAVMNLALSIVLAHYTGVAGVVLGTVISQTLCIYIPSAFYVPKILKSRLAAAPQPAQ